MKKISILLCAITAILLISCNRQSFISANEMYNTFCTLYLKDGKTLTGYLSVKPVFRKIEDDITYKNEIKGEKQFIKIADMEGFSIRGNFYSIIQTDRFTLNNEGDMMFARRITTADSKIQLYELEDDLGVNNRTTLTKFSYYIHFPFQKKYEAWNIDDKMLVPNFDKKMSEYVKEKPAFSEKIKNKEKGYFYPQLTSSDERKLEIIQKIIAEYNQP